ncbi:reverse transcriptase domain-containing protein [Tanacetum coccineum]
MAPTTRKGQIPRLTTQNQYKQNLGIIQALIGPSSFCKITNGDGSHSSHGDNRRNVQTARPCFYADFMKCQPLNFKGTEGVVGLTRWIEKMESVFNISGCAIENQVKFATCTLLGAALTWWNGQIRTLGPEAYAMTWEVLKKKMTDKYCPQGEIKKLEIELWNLKVKGNDVPAYTERFQELTLICTKFVANETEKVDKSLVDFLATFNGMSSLPEPRSWDETNVLANDLMDQKFRTYADRAIDTKGRLSSSRKTWSPTATLQEAECRQGLQYGDRQKEALWGIFAQVHQVPSPPQWPIVHPEVPQVQQNKAIRSRWQVVLVAQNVANNQKGNGQPHKGLVVLSVEHKDIFKRDCLETND